MCDCKCNESVLSTKKVEQPPLLTREEYVWIAVAGSNDCKDSSIPNSWANRGLNDFRNKFG
jgi:hypothetical protein